MNLTPEQITAAKAIGCAFFPATEMQVQRLTMQQRVFRVDGKPFLVSRDGSYYETIGTLRALLAAAAVQARPPQNATVPQDVSRQSEPDPAPEAEPAGPPAMPETAPQAGPPVAEPSIVESAAPAAATAPRKRGRPRKAAAAPPPEPREPEPREPEPREPEPLVEAEAAEAPPPAAAAPPEFGEAARGGRLARLARRRAGGPPPPKWQTAGPARRGRLKRF